MKVVVMILIGLGIGGAMLFYYTNQQAAVQNQVEQQQAEAQEAAENYRINQQRMMEQLGQ